MDKISYKFLAVIYRSESNKTPQYQNIEKEFTSISPFEARAKAIDYYYNFEDVLSDAEKTGTEHFYSANEILQTSPESFSCVDMALFLVLNNEELLLPLTQRGDEFEDVLEQLENLQTEFYIYKYNSFFMQNKYMEITVPDEFEGKNQIEIIDDNLLEAEIINMDCITVNEIRNIQ